MLINLKSEEALKMDQELGWIEKTCHQQTQKQKNIALVVTKHRIDQIFIKEEDLKDLLFTARSVQANKPYEELEN